jgi:hypothetical protein
MLSYHVGQIDVIVVRDQPPFAMSGLLHGLGGEKAKAPSTPCIIPGMGFEWLLQFSLYGINSRVGTEIALPHH